MDYRLMSLPRPVYRCGMLQRIKHWNWETKKDVYCCLPWGSLIYKLCHIISISFPQSLLLFLHRSIIFSLAISLDLTGLTILHFVKV